MKKTMIYVALVCTVGLGACNKSSNPKSDTVEGVTNMMGNGTWRITYFMDDSDKTSGYTGYRFSFATDNSVTVSKDMDVYTGTWSITDSNPKKNKLSDLDFNLTFLSPDLFEELSDDWDILEKTETMIKLADDNGSGTDYLTFERN